MSILGIPSLSKTAKFFVDAGMTQEEAEKAVNEIAEKTFKGTKEEQQIRVMMEMCKKRDKFKRGL